MIYEALQILGEQLDNYLSSAGQSNLVTFENNALRGTSVEFSVDTSESVPSPHIRSGNHQISYSFYQRPIFKI